MSDEFDPANPPTGLILPADRTVEQQKAHEDSLAGVRNFAVPFKDYPVGTKVMLTDFWKKDEVVADIGQPFTGFGQYTGSCVGVSNGNAVTTVLCVQRLLDEEPTSAGVVWWPFNYGRTRFAEGDRGPGEGAVDSVIGKVNVEQGFISIAQPGLPQFLKTGPDGWWLSKSIELQWSYLPNNSNTQKWVDLAKPNAGMSKTVCNSVEDIRTSIMNGYPVLDGCSMFCGRGKVQGSGDLACAVGVYDGRGGHSTCFLGVWYHPTFGWMYLYSNQWSTSTYPRDPAGGGRCCVWMLESTVKKLFSLGGNRGETFSLYNVPGQPAQPKVLDYLY